MCITVSSLTGHSGTETKSYEQTIDLLIEAYGPGFSIKRVN